MKASSNASLPDLNPESLEALRYEHDELASKALERLLQIAGSDGAGCGHANGRVDLYATLQAYHGSNPILTEFWEQTTTVPEWADWQAIARGQKIFYRHAVANIVGFALQGFIGENAAAFGPAEVLIRTGGLSTRNLLRRVMETFQWLIEATESLESIQPLGKGHISTVRIRLLHASVRRRLLSLADTHRGYFDTTKYGTPINTYDSILTITFFCCNPIWIQLPQLGIRLSLQEEADFVALYRYLSYLLGTPDSYFASTETAKATMEAMLADKGRPTEASRIIANSFVDCLADREPVFISRGFLEAGSRSMNGDKLCDQLGLGRPSFVNYACFTSFCWLIRLVNGVQRLSPATDGWVIKYFRRQLPRLVEAGLGGAFTFDFQYIPRLAREKIEASSTCSRGVPLLSRKLELFLFMVYVSGVSIVVWTAGSLLLVVCWCAWYSVAGQVAKVTA